MATTAGPDEQQAAPPRRRWSVVGPGIVVAATGVGAGDLVATLVAGSRFGYALLWAAVLGCVVKIALAEATGRWHLATGRTIFAGWRTLGAWTSVYFAVYVVVWGFVYGAAAMSSTALPLAALFPGLFGDLTLQVFGIVAGLTGLALVWFGGYGLFEKVMAALVGIMFVTVVSVAVLVVPDLGALGTGLLPTIPDGAGIYTLGLIGGVGGTITMAAYGYWINAKGWTDASWMRIMRLDNRVAYAVTGVFVIAMLVVGAELLAPLGVALAEGDRGLLDLDEVLRAEFGPVVSVLFLIGFAATAYSSLLGVWQGVSLLVSDFVRNLRSPVEAGAEEVASGRAERTPAFRAYVLWLAIPPISLLFLDRPFQLVILYGFLGALFMPFLAGTLLWLLNSGRTPREHRNGVVSNVLLVAAGLLFLVIAGDEVVGLLQEA